MPETVLSARLYHESNTYVNGKTTRSDFKDHGGLYGDEIPAALSGTNTEVGGIIEVADEIGVELHHTIVAEAEPGGPVTESAYHYYVDQIVESVEECVDSIDGVILPLHGAMVPEHSDDGEGPLIARVRSVVGSDVPIVVTIDPNANVSDEMVNESDAIIAYETTPHVDTRETGKRGMRLLIRAIREQIDPVMQIERPPVIPSAVRSTTLEPPMSELADRARDLEDRTDVLKVNVCQGFWSADVPYMGFSIVTVADGNPIAASETARDVSRRVWDRREEFIEETISAEEAVRRAKDTVANRTEPAAPVVIAEMHDNPGGGKPADGTKVLRALLNQNVSNAGLAILRDPEAVAACVEAGVGERVTIDVGGKTEEPDVYGSTIEDLDGYVKALTDGQYVNTGPMKTGTRNNLGTTVRLQCGQEDGLTVILTEKRIQPLDAEIWRHVGLQPERLDVIAVKSAVHYRADYHRITDELISVDESPDLEYRRITRPKYPLDVMSEEAYPDW
ncbi:M81 family metallopeptidase [Saliphagus sp. LR7]|uniref:M81 family metallopeptidase n=1 Tax=Saliphagus sp. LR7 TaxID=2282654 RepID=UPI000DF85E5E|nr:M81 family metallopeptidase [Saliphagus sp. LR7]